MGYLVDARISASEKDLPVLNIKNMYVPAREAFASWMAAVLSSTFSSEPPRYEVPVSLSLSRKVPNILSKGVPLVP